MGYSQQRPRVLWLPNRSRGPGHDLGILGIFRRAKKKSLGDVGCGIYSLKKRIQCGRDQRGSWGSLRLRAPKLDRGRQALLKLD